MNRQSILEKIEQNPNYSILIIGGGINGIGTFRDLALQGVDVLLVERGDFASGASAASSHMVHGGIRYLENGEFRLVREAVQERNRLIENAPHYVRPLPTTIPMFKWFSGLFNAPFKFLGWLDKPGERGGVVIKLGLMMYDAYTGSQGTVPKHRFLAREASLRQFPHMNPDIVATATYYDGAMPSPERIALELLLDGEATHPRAHALNYLSAVGAAGDTVELRDELTGQSLSVKPQLVINAAGPWIDFANEALGQSTHFIGGTKGSHIVLDHPELLAATGDREIFFENDDGRIVLIFPFVEGRVMVGTTDIKIDDPDEARCTEAEIDYFFELVGKVFPKIQVDRSQIVYRFSGVRPLPASDANMTGQISRDHENRVVEPNGTVTFPVFNLIGGKWTTFRAFAEKVTDDALARLGRPRLSHTRNLAIGGGQNYPRTKAAQQAWVAQIAAETAVSMPRIEQLFDRYGTRAALIATYIAQAPDQPLAADASYSRREILFITEQEKVARLADFFQRRSLLAMIGLLSDALLVEVADIIATGLTWSAEQKEAELTAFRQLLADRHGVSLTRES